MDKNNKLTIVNSKKIEDKTFYVPMSKFEVTLYKVKAKTSIQAQEIFNGLQNGGDKKVVSKTSRRITIQETDANNAYVSNEVPAFIDIVNRQVDHFTYEDEDLELQSNHLSLVH